MIFNNKDARWFGLVFLPFISFSADGVVALALYLKRTVIRVHGGESAAETLAKAQTIDLSIQFTLFWMPFLVLLGWWTGKPLTLLFGE
jgi:Ca2+:H+ antiporter